MCWGVHAPCDVHAIDIIFSIFLCLFSLLQSYILRQETARSRRALNERGLTRGFLEADDSQQEDNQGLSYSLKGFRV